MQPGQDILSQLKTTQLSAERVKFVVLPDLRLDHTGELESLSQAAAVVTREEHVAELSSSTLGLYMADEFDQVEKWQFVDFSPATPLGTFARSHDLFGDGSIELIDVAGATAGGLAALVRLARAARSPVWAIWPGRTARRAMPGCQVWPFSASCGGKKSGVSRNSRTSFRNSLSCPAMTGRRFARSRPQTLPCTSFLPPQKTRKVYLRPPDFSGPSGPARLGEAWKSPSSVMVR